MRLHAAAVMVCTGDASPITILTLPEAGMQISQEQAEDLLKEDLKRFEAAVNRYVTGALTQGRFDAPVSFTFNVGEGALKKSTLLKKMNAGDMDGDAREFDRNSVQNR